MNYYENEIFGICRVKLILILLSILASKGYTQDCAFEETGVTNCTLYVRCQNIIIKNMYSLFTRNWRCFQNQRYSYYSHVHYSFTLYINISEIYEAPDWSTLGDIAHNVKSIEIKNGSLEELVTTSLPNLEYLTIVNNIITSFTINEISNVFPLLRQIDLSFNSISALHNNPNGTNKCNLKHINISNNLITQIPDLYFVKCSDLLYLDLSHNLITTFNILTFEGIYNLITLKLSNNKIFDVGLHFQRFLSLQNLYLDSNQLTSLTSQSFSNLKKLQHFNVSNNDINHLDNTVFYDMNELNVLDLSFNNIEIISSTIFVNNKNLQTLDFKYNKIKIIEEGAFNNNTAVTVLNLDNNFLQGFIDKKVFAGIILLDEFDLGGQKITGIGSEFINGTNIRCLNFTSNLITNISATAFKEVTNLRILDISHNFITVLEFDVELPNLSKLYLKNNSLHSLKVTSPNNLTYLDLSHNKIDNSSNNVFTNMNHLKNIDLSFNELGIVSLSTFKGLNEITLMNLRYSVISMLSNFSFQDFHYLNKINVSYNQIKTIEFNTFYQTDALEKLDISHNILTSFNINTSNLINIQELLLDDNKIENISSDSLANLTKLKILNISQNNLLNINNDIFNNLIQLKTLILSNNKKIISQDFNFKQFTNTSIENLDMSCNEIINISSMAIYFAKKLVDLKLHCNSIEIVDKMSFQELQFLRQLDLYNNVINYIQPGSFLHINELQDLNLSNNHLSNLEYGTFNGLHNLKLLNLSNNVLFSFAVNLFKNSAPNIYSIVLDNNIISEIDFEKFMSSNVKVLSLGGNPLPCPLLDSYMSIENQNFTITSGVKDYHSENVKGITCRYQHSKSLNYSKNESISLITPLLNAIESNAFYTKQLININKHTSDIMEDAIKKLIESNTINNEINSFNTSNLLNTSKQIMSSLIEEVIKKLNETPKTNNENNSSNTNQFVNINKDILSDLIEKAIRKFNETNKIQSYQTQEHNDNNYKFKDKIPENFENENNNIVNSLKTSALIDDKISQNELSNGTNNSNLDGLVYFILTCVILIIIFLILVSAYIFYKMKRHQDKSLNVSIHELSNNMDI